MVKTIIDDSFTNYEELILAESKLIVQFISDPLNRNYYIPNKGFSTYGMSHSEETKAKMRKPKSEEFKQKLRKPKSEEFKENLRGRTLSQETRDKMSESKQNISDETREKLSIKGKSRTGEKNSMYGRTHSEETKQKMRKPKSRKSRISESHKSKIKESLSGKSKPIIKCNYCGKVGGLPQMKQWHLDKCKHRFGGITPREETKNNLHGEEKE